MARELGLSPKNFPKYANTKDQPWKVPLPDFIEALYLKQFKRPFPEQVQTLEQMAAEHMARRESRKAEKLATTESESETETDANLGPSSELEPADEKGVEAGTMDAAVDSTQPPPSSDG